MKESHETEITILDIRHSIFLILLEYLYTDDIEVPIEMAMELFMAADRYGIERLLTICESRMLSSLCVENAATVFHAADLHNAKSLRDRCLHFILLHFDQVTKSTAFEEMGRTNVDLVFEVLKLR